MSVSNTLLALILGGLCSFILGKLYVKYGTSLSNRWKFANNFVLLTTTTTFIIIIVKSSLALSLGLVGALSIVRFRAAIKEPEELAFLFLNIALGLGFGAYQWRVTIISFIVIALLIVLRHKHSVREEKQNLHLIISSKETKSITLKSIKNILMKHSSSLELKRFDNKGEHIEASFLVNFNSFDDLDKAKTELKKLNKSIDITYLDRS